MSDRPDRFCDICGGLDDHPRHVKSLQPDANDGAVPDERLAEFDLSGAPPDAVRQLLAGNVTVRHMDCCAAAGCETCQETEKANGEKRGQELIDHLAAERAAAGTEG